MLINRNKRPSLFGIFALLITGHAPLAFPDPPLHNPHTRTTRSHTTNENHSVARDNLAWVKGDITGDIYFDIFHLDGKDVQYLRLYLMVKGVVGAVRVRLWAAGRAGVWARAQGQPVGRDWPHPAAQNAQRRDGLRDCRR